MNIHYALHFADKTEGGDCITHTTTGTSETSTEAKHSGVYYKIFLFNILLIIANNMVLNYFNCANSFISIC